MKVKSPFMCVPWELLSAYKSRATNTEWPMDPVGAGEMANPVSPGWMTGPRGQPQSGNPTENTRCNRHNNIGWKIRSCEGQDTRRP